MEYYYRLAKLLVCCWILGGEEGEDLPTAQGILDRALQLSRADGAFPAWVWEKLHFAESRVGLQCVELPEILDWAQTADLTQVPNPSYQTTRVKIDARLARRLLAGLGVSAEEASAWGQQLHRCARQALREFAAAG